jgi:uncharacterized membrane protein
MDMGLAAILVALITTIGGIVVGFMQSFKKETISARAVDRVGDKLETHIDRHGEGVYGKTTGTNPN